MGSSGYWISSEFEKSAYLPREIHFLKTINKLLNSEKQKLVEQLSKKYIQYFSKKYKEWIDLYATHLKNADIVVTHQPTWTWISGEEKLEKNIKYINGHDHYYLGNSFSKRVKGHAFDKTAENNYNDGQNTYFGNYRTPIKFFII
jgi:uncharacterized protein YaaW (UPF0174 family)